MKKRFSLIRFVIQLAFFIFLPALFATAFAGIKYLAEQLHKTEMISWNLFLATLIVLLLCTIIFGRIFCGYACAFGSLGDWLYACSSFVQKKLRGKIFKLPDKIISKMLYLKYFILMGIIILILTGTYTFVGQADPWEIFASFRSGNFHLSGKIYAGILLGIIAVGMLFIERFFCMFLCPMGAIFALLPTLPLTAYNRSKKECIPGCTICTRTCPASITLGEENSRYSECFQCGKCMVKCPKECIRPGFRQLR